jgi:hypothetical protein
MEKKQYNPPSSEITVDLHTENQERGLATVTLCFGIMSSSLPEGCYNRQLNCTRQFEFCHGTVNQTGWQPQSVATLCRLREETPLPADLNAKKTWLPLNVDDKDKANPRAEYWGWEEASN